MFKGDLNALQQEALQWLLIDEADNQSAVLETQLKFTVLANNPQLYNHIWPDNETANVEWLTPQSEEEIQAIIEQLERDLGSEQSLTNTTSQSHSDTEIVR